jgi:hypothetical protein
MKTAVLCGALLLAVLAWALWLPKSASDAALGTGASLLETEALTADTHTTGRAASDLLSPKVDGSKPVERSSVVISDPRPSPAGLHVEVRNAAGQALSGAKVLPLPRSLQPERSRIGLTGFDGILEHLAQHRWTQATAETDVVGCAHFQLEPQSVAGILTWLDKGLAHWTPLAAPTPWVIVELPATRELTGVVRLNGAPPTETIRLTLRRSLDPSASWPTQARDVARSLKLAWEQLDTGTLEDGGFEFAAAPADTHLELRALGPFRSPKGGEPKMTVAPGSGPLLLELIRADGVLVELVPNSEADRGTEVELVAKFSTPGREDSVHTAHAVIGALVEIELPQRALGTLALEARGSAGTLGRQTFEPIATGDRARLQLLLPEPREGLSLLATDGQGVPLEPFEVLYDGQRYASQHGPLQLLWGPDLGELVIGAPQHAARAIDPSSLEQGLNRIPLEPANRLVLHYRPVDASGGHGLGVDVLGGWDDQTPTARLRGPPPRDLDHSGTWTALDLPPGKPLTLVLRDGWDFELHRTEITPPASGTLSAEFEVHGYPGTIVGRVTDPSGHPLPHAQIQVLVPSPPGRPIAFDFWRDLHAVDDSGEFVLTGIFDPQPVLILSAPNHITRQLAPGECTWITHHVLRPTH